MGYKYESSPKKVTKIVLDVLKLDKRIQTDTVFIYFRKKYLQNL